MVNSGFDGRGWTSDVAEEPGRCCGLHSPARSHDRHWVQLTPRLRVSQALALAAVAVANSCRSQRLTRDEIIRDRSRAQKTDPRGDCLQDQDSRNHKESGPCARGVDVGLEPGLGSHRLSGTCSATFLMRGWLQKLSCD